ncbi:MAG: hypothetical protein IKK16_00015 [Bacteroidaceae bacterium]|nr:hypothetical protein [Bacteroidaceae bacterium]
MKNKNLFLVCLLSCIVGTMQAERLFIDNFSIAPGETKTMSIELENEISYVAFEFEITMPEGLTIDTISTSLTDRCYLYESHGIKLWPEGFYKFLAYSTKYDQGAGITGNSGKIVNLKVTASEDMEVGSTPTIAISNILFEDKEATDDVKWEAALIEQTITIVETPAGPANRFYIEDFEIEAGGTYRLPMNLVNEGVFNWFTATLTLPEGLSFDGTLTYNEARVTGTKIYDDTSYPTDGSKVLNLDFSARNDFEGTEGALVYLDVVADADLTGNATITLTDIIFYDADEVEYPLEDASCVATLPAVESNEVELLVQNSYYNNLTLYLTKGDTQKLKIEQTDDYFVLNTILFNGEDVTEEFVEGVYTTPAIEENSVLNISFTIPTAQNAPMQNSRIKAYGHRGDVVVAGCERGESIAVYDVDGVLLRTMYATSDTMRIAMPTDAVYVVKVADTAVKVAL